MLPNEMSLIADIVGHIACKATATRFSLRDPTCISRTILSRVGYTGGSSLVTQRDLPRYMCALPQNRYGTGNHHVPPLARTFGIHAEGVFS